MEFTKGTIQVQLFLQKLVQPPFKIQIEQPEDKKINYYLNTPKLKVFANVNLPAENKSTLEYITDPNRRWKVIKFNFCVMCLASIGRIIWLKSNWERLQDFEQLGYYTLLSALIFIAIFSFEAIDKHVPQICFLIHETLRIVGKFHIAKMPKGN